MTMIYEQPMNEVIRACLRVDALVQRMPQPHDAAHCDTTHAEQGLMNVVDLLNVLDRPDLKNKLCQRIQHTVRHMQHFAHHPDVDGTKCQQTVERLQACHDTLQHLHHLGQPLKDHAFLRQCRQLAAHPGGLLMTSHPLVRWWQAQPPRERLAHSYAWMEALQPVTEAVHWLLQWTRHTQPWTTLQADQGFYQQTLAPHRDWLLVRVKLIGLPNCFPQISLSKHRLVMHFHTPHLTDNGYEQNTTDRTVLFELACCQAH